MIARRLWHTLPGYLSRRLWGEVMKNRNYCDEAGARSDGLMIVSVLFIVAFTYIAFTTNPVYTGVGVGDRAPELEGQVFNGNTWSDYSLADNIDPMWQEGDGGTWTMVEFMDTNCGYCQKVAQDEFPTQQSSWLGFDASRSTPANVSVEFGAVSIMLWDENTQGKEYGRDVIEQFRSDYGHNFPYMDVQDNSHQSDWGGLGTPTYFLIAPNGIIEYATPEADQGYSIWDAMEDKIPRGG